MSAPNEQLAALTGSDPVAAMQAAYQLARPDEAIPTDITVSLYSDYYVSQGQCGDYIEMTCTFPRLKLPDGTLKLKGADPFAQLALTCDTTVVPVVIEIADGALRWSGRVDVAHDKLYEDGTETVECELVGDLTMLDRITAWPEPFLPIEIQPSEAILIGPAITVFKTLVAENCMRLQLGLWELFNTLGSLDLDWRTWFGTLLMQQDLSLTDLMQMVTTPVCVVPTDPLTDTSPWIAIHGRMDTCWKLMRQQLADNGLYASMDLWLPGDPQPEGLLWDLQVATMCFNLKDYQGVTGPTGTIVDGAVRDLVDLEGGLLGNALAPFLNPNNEYVPPGSNIEIAPTLGVNFNPPWVVFNADVDDSGIVSMDIAHHHPVCWQIILGGRSPQWACPPLGNRGGTSPRANLTQRRYERHLGVAGRSADDDDRHYRHLEHAAGWHPGQRLPGVRTVRILRPPCATRSVWVSGAVLPDAVDLRHRHPLCRHIRVVGHGRLPGRAVHVLQRNALALRERRFPGHAGVDHPPQHPLHGLSRRDQGHRQRAGARPHRRPGRRRQA
ncbi:Gp37-like protein [Mycobacterium branderi]|uniref:Gp28/Gp37-like domain-containing protein n=1 Tax=Mycobacterium branderi TaxID=43348 RepID=A0ABN6AYY8_9MYCO|nr:hypothetical protein [Mycobacterium branderi]BBZ09856.1 hypothetical protein MBRA_00510 [Mycobacterium branderi]